MKSVHCSQCGKELLITRKALPKYGRVINLIDPHECGEVVEPDWPIVSVPLPPSGGKKFVKKLNELQPPPKDLRPLPEIEPKVVSTVPETILDHLKKLNI